MPGRWLFRGSRGALSVGALWTIAHATSAAYAAAPDPIWRPLACRTCERAGLSIDVRTSGSGTAKQGGPVLARVRNRNQYDAIARVEFRARHAAHDDGALASEEWNVGLAAAGTDGWESVLILRRSDPTDAIVHDVQRY